MIGFFPDIYKDELLYSQLCRYFQRTGYTKYIFAVDDLFMRRTVHPSIEWVNEYTPDAFTHITRNTDFETVIREHTMFPAYARFLPKERRAAALHSLLICDGNHNNLVLNQHLQCKRFLRYCPACSKEDRDQYGETYWHREHQIININICPKHRCYLLDSSVPIGSRFTPGLFPADLAVPFDCSSQPCLNDMLIEFTEYALEIFRAPVDMDCDTPLGSFLRSRLDNQYYSKSHMTVSSAKLYEHYCEFVGSFLEPISFEGFQKIYNNCAVDHYRIYQLAFFQHISTEALVKPTISLANTVMDELYHELSNTYSIDYSVICKIGESICSTYRMQGKLSRKSGPKQREWATLDDTYLPRVKEIVDKIYCTDGRPGRVSIRRVEREFGAPSKQFQNLPKCSKYINDHYETTREYRARQVTWAVKQFLDEGCSISVRKINHFLNFRKNDLLSCLDHIQDPEVRSILLSLLGTAKRDLECNSSVSMRVRDTI